MVDNDVDRRPDPLHVVSPGRDSTGDMLPSWMASILLAEGDLQTTGEGMNMARTW
jgi:hypothetical protein